MTLFLHVHHKQTSHACYYLLPAVYLLPVIPGQQRLCTDTRETWRLLTDTSTTWRLPTDTRKTWSLFTDTRTTWKLLTDTRTTKTPHRYQDNRDSSQTLGQHGDSSQTPGPCGDSSETPEQQRDSSQTPGRYGDSSQTPIQQWLLTNTRKTWRLHKARPWTRNQAHTFDKNVLTTLTVWAVSLDFKLGLTYYYNTSAEKKQKLSVSMGTNCKWANISPVLSLEL